MNLKQSVNYNNTWGFCVVCECVALSLSFDCYVYLSLSLSVVCTCCFMRTHICEPRFAYAILLLLSCCYPQRAVNDDLQATDRRLYCAVRWGVDLFTSITHLRDLCDSTTWRPRQVWRVWPKCVELVLRIVRSNTMAWSALLCSAVIGIRPMLWAM